MKNVIRVGNEDVEIRDWLEADIMWMQGGMEPVVRDEPYEAIAYDIEVSFLTDFTQQWWRRLLEWFVLRFAWANRWWVRRQKRAFVQYTLTVEGGNGLLRSFAHNRDAVYKGAGVFTWRRRLEIPLHIEADKKWTLECYIQGCPPGQVVLGLGGLVTRAEINARIREFSDGFVARPVM